MRIGLRILVLAGVLLPVVAQAMTVETFLAKAKALQAKGPFALASSDLSLLRAEVKDAGAAYRAQIEADRLAGKRPRACPPPVGQAQGQRPERVLRDDGPALPVQMRVTPSIPKQSAAVRT